MYRVYHALSVGRLLRRKLWPSLIFTASNESSFVDVLDEGHTVTLCHLVIDMICSSSVVA